MLLADTAVSSHLMISKDGKYQLRGQIVKALKLLSTSDSSKAAAFLAEAATACHAR